jgi:hypothetical protein
MAYTLHRIFCSTPGGLEAERQAFHEVIGQVNETEGMPKSILFVPVSIVPNIVDKTAFQSTVDANVRDCKFFVQVLQNTWGPPTKNFETEFNLASRLKSDPGALMSGVSIFFKAADGLEIEPTILRLKASSQSQESQSQESQSQETQSRDCSAHEFATLDEYKQRLRMQLSAWLRAVEV